MTTVGELIKELQKYDENKIVFLASDEEGNSFSPFYFIDDNAVINLKTNDYMGILRLTEDLQEQGFTEEDFAETNKQNVPAIILYP